MAEGADWDDEKLELVDGRRPVVYPAAGSHANSFDPALYVGSLASRASAATTPAGRISKLEPKARFRATPPRPGSALPWITFEGRWGELQDAFFNGPTGPNLKEQ